MTLSKAFLDDLKARFRLSDVIGRSVKLTRAGREFKGLSPFTNEKTPSFFVNDEKGFFHCFSSGEHGDVISFLTKTKGLSFYEAVKLLADEAGVELPQQTAEDRAREQRRASLIDVMEMAARLYQDELRRKAGSGARDYLQRRGIADDTVAEFRLGFAPAERTLLRDALNQKGVTPEQMLEAGLVIAPEDGGAPFDRFRNRLMFPITDFAGRVIAFGGRALDDQPAKYLNSPETPLFHKGAVLYNFRAARERLQRASDGPDRPLIVAEGYMDVIALSDAGFAAVAPLGTALTELQLETLWRVVPEPVLCFDGDRAGLAAAHRAADRALPLLKPGHSLRFALLPEGRDPDDVVRGEGAGAMRGLIDRALPLADLLWARELEAAPVDTPERRAGFEQRLRTLLQRIGEARVRSHYGSEFKARLDGLFRRSDPRPPRSGRFDARGRTPGRGVPAYGGRPPAVPSGQAQSEALLVLTVLNHPALLETHLEAFADIDLTQAKLDRLRAEIIRIASAGPLDRAQLHDHLSGTHVADELTELQGRSSLVKDHPFARADSPFDTAEKGWLHLINMHWGVERLRQELREAEQVLARDFTEENFDRLKAVRAQVHAAELAERERAAARSD